MEEEFKTIGYEGSEYKTKGPEGWFQKSVFTSLQPITQTILSEEIGSMDEVEGTIFNNTLRFERILKGMEDEIPDEDILVLRQVQNYKENINRILAEENEWTPVGPPNIINKETREKFHDSIGNQGSEEPIPYTYSHFVEDIKITDLDPEWVRPTLGEFVKLNDTLRVQESALNVGDICEVIKDIYNGIPIIETFLSDRGLPYIVREVRTGNSVRLDAQDVQKVFRGVEGLTTGALQRLGLARAVFGPDPLPGRLDPLLLLSLREHLSSKAPPSVVAEHLKNLKEENAISDGGGGGGRGLEPAPPAVPIQTESETETWGSYLNRNFNPFRETPDRRGGRSKSKRSKRSKRSKKSKSNKRSKKSKKSKKSKRSKRSKRR